MPIIGILAAAALLSGFSSIIGSETAIAQQQNVTGTNATAANATGNQTATSSNQTGAAAATSGGSNNAATAGSYYPYEFGYNNKRHREPLSLFIP
jgi:hypothetical protein